MLGRQSIRVTYSHKRRRVQNPSKKLLSSPLEVLPPDMDDLTRTQMARRMLKRSRRVALSEQLEDKNVEHIREHLAKRIKRTQERVSNVETTEVAFDMSSQDDFTFQTPFSSSQSVHESAVENPPVPEQFSPVPAAKRIMSRTSSRNLKENSTHSQILASPFSSRPGSAAPSPRKHKGKERSSRRVSRISLHAKSRTLSGVFKENTRQVLRKDSTVSLKDMDRGPSPRHIKHRRYPSSPSTSYMRSQFAHEDWIAPPKVLPRTFGGYSEIPSPSGSVHSNSSFYIDQPQSCSTPAISRLGKLPDSHGRQTRTENSLASFALRKGSTEASSLDVAMMDGTRHPRRQTIHLSGNSIFSSSDEFTIGSLPAAPNGGMITERNNVAGRDEASALAVRQVSAHREAVDRSQAGYSLAGSFVAEYDIPLSDSDRSPASTAATKMFGPRGVHKSSVGEQPFGLPGTSPARGETNNMRTYRNPVVPKSSVGEQPFGLPGTSPVRGEPLIIHTSRNSSVPKSSVGEQQFGLPGTSPARGETNDTGASRNSGVPKSSVVEQQFGLPGTSPSRGESFINRTFRNPGTLTPPASPPNTSASCLPSSPASDLALDLLSMDIRGMSHEHCLLIVLRHFYSMSFGIASSNARVSLLASLLNGMYLLTVSGTGDPDMHSDGETHRPSTSIPLQMRSRSLRGAPAGSTTHKFVKRMPARNRAGTIRASDFAKPGAPSSHVSPRMTVPPLSNVRRTRSGTVVGPDSKLAAKGAGLSNQATKGAPARLAAVPSRSESESDDELLLKGFWFEDLEYLGLAVPPGRKDAEADELNLGGLWHGLECGPPRRPGLRRR